jgi:CheY-like chemotaxis protein
MDFRSARVVVDDRPSCERSFSTAFVVWAFRTCSPFEDGRRRCAKVIKLKPDLVLTDVHMQPVGGIEFVRQLRGLPNNQISNTKVIFLSADSSMSTVGEALPLGVSGYLVKPPSLAALSAKIEAALKK